MHTAAQCESSAIARWSFVDVVSQWARRACSHRCLRSGEPLMERDGVLRIKVWPEPIGSGHTFILNTPSRSISGSPERKQRCEHARLAHCETTSTNDHRAIALDSHCAAVCTQRAVHNSYESLTPEHGSTLCHLHHRESSHPHDDLCGLHHSLHNPF